LIDLLLTKFSYVGIVLILVISGAGLPIPEEVPVVAAGIASSNGYLHPWLAFIACIIGAVGGDIVLYTIGYHFGHSLVYRHPRFAHLLHADREAKIEQMIRRHEVKVLFLARFMVGVRAPVYLAAGILRIPFLRFLIIDVICATLVVGLFFGLSYAYGDRLTRLIKQSEIGLSVIGVTAALAVLGVWLWRRRRKRLLAAVSEQPAEETCAVGAEDSKNL
jgi:LPXTG-motif cell wall-anchored protein